MDNSEKIIKKLKMTPHPEGGYYRETYKNDNVSLIYYLLKKDENSHWHRLKKNEILHFYSGDPLKVFMSNDEINVKEITLDKEFGNNRYLHYVIEAGTWFYMVSEGEYSLIGCTVSPPFDYKDFELADPEWNPINFNQNF